MKTPEFKGKTVSLSDTVRFRCQRCTECCRHVHEVVPVEPLDLYRISKRLLRENSDPAGISRIIDQFFDAVVIDESGFFMLMLKSTGDDQHCIFLEGNKCTIHTDKPRACRTYPLVIYPTESGRLEYFISTEREHHFKGPAFRVRNLVRKTMTEEDKTFLLADMSYSVKIAHELRGIEKNDLEHALNLLLLFRYADYNTEKPFMPQYVRNNEKLLYLLGRMKG